GAKGAADEEENSGRAGNASEERGRVGSGPSGGADAHGDGDHAAGSARVGLCGRVGGTGWVVSRGGEGPGRSQGPAGGPAHGSSLGHGGHRAHLRRPPGPSAPTAGPTANRPGSDLALGGGVSRARSTDRPAAAAAAGRGLDAPVRGESRGAAAR